MNHSSKNICLITLSLKVGGAERFISELTNYLVSQGHKVSVVALFKKPKFYSIDEKVNFYEPSFTRNTTNKFTYFFKLWNYLRNTVKKINPDTIFNVAYNSLVVFYLLGLNYPLYISNRSNPLKPRKMWYRIIRRLMYSRANGIIVQTSVAKQHFYKETGNRNIIIIPNFVRQIKTIRSELNSNNYITTVGRFIRSKNLKSLVNIFSKIKGNNWKLLLVGDGPERDAIEKEVNNLGLSDSVIFAGYQKNVDRYLQQSKIFAFTSLSEGFPNALLEAMATPLPCVAYNCNAGPADLITNNDNGFLVDINDEALFLKRLNELISNPDLRTHFANKGLEVREKYSLAVIGNKLLQAILP